MQVSEKPTRKSPRKRSSQTAVTNIKSSPSIVRKVIIQDHAYTSEPCESAAASKEISTLRNEMRILKQKLKRKDLKITNMEHLLKALKEKELVNDENHRLLDHNFGGTMAQEIFKNQAKNTATTSNHAMRYTNELKSFAVTLHYYSLKAYEFTRKILALPDPASIRAWGCSVQCEPRYLFWARINVQPWFKRNWLGTVFLFSMMKVFVFTHSSLMEHTQISIQLSS